MNQLRKAIDLLRHHDQLQLKRAALEAVIADPYNHVTELGEVCKMLHTEKTIIPKAIALLGTVKSEIAELEREDV